MDQDNKDLDKIWDDKVASLAEAMRLKQMEALQQSTQSVSSFSTKAKVIGVVVLLVFLAGICYVAYSMFERIAKAEEEVRKAKVVSEQAITDKNVLQNQLSMSKQNAEMMADFAKKAMSGGVAPSYSFTVKAPDVQTAAGDVANRINKNDPTLPPEVLKKSDYTFSVPNMQDPKNYKVDVYKVNTYKNWELGVGVGVHKGDPYVPVSIQRNYSKDHALEAEIHVDKSGVSGGAIKYKVATDKLFFFF